jgi:hypothetical protein
LTITTDTAVIPIASLSGASLQEHFVTIANEFRRLAEKWNGIDYDWSIIAVTDLLKNKYSSSVIARAMNFAVQEGYIALEQIKGNASLLVVAGNMAPKTSWY